MENVTIKVEKKKMIIELDITKEIGLSKSGKSMNIATTNGNHKVTTDIGEVTVGLNVYKSAKGK